MPLCLETICVRNRQLQNLSAHNDRYYRTRQALWQLHESAPLETVIRVPDWLESAQTYKCRVIYGPDVQEVQFEAYKPRPLRTLKLIDADGLDYSYKYAERGPLNDLFSQRGSADDVLLVRQGLLTDTSYANIALFDGTGWLTPADPLLPGTMRAHLLANNVIKPAFIRADELSRFSRIRVFNAMLDWQSAPTIAIDKVRTDY